MITVREYVERLFRNIPDSEEARNMKQEILQNLEEKVADLMENGKSEEDAINKAIVDFGDFEEIKNELTPTAEIVREPAVKSKKKKNIKNAMLYSIFGSLMVIALMVFINYYYSPRTIWFVYPTFAILWWPLSMFFVWRGRKDD